MPLDGQMLLSLYLARFLPLRPISARPVSRRGFKMLGAIRRMTES